MDKLLKLVSWFGPKKRSEPEAKAPNRALGLSSYPVFDIYGAHGSDHETVWFYERMRWGARV